ncbi:MAG: type IV secretion system DNA-binding domain-containing protein [Selenomonadaceae bacterium]|nr:type IV secretion system DNA-binding domain-containing protein [Selenomonadaceae bacterium]
MERRKKYILMGLGVFGFLLALYYAVAVIVSVHFFRQPIPAPATLAKYTVSRAADFVGFPWLYFRIPEEFEAEILKEDSARKAVHWRSYHHLLDDDNVPHNSFFYIAFPLFLLASIAASAGIYLRLTAAERAKPEAKRHDVFVRGVRCVSPSELCQMVKKGVSDPAAYVQTDGGNLIFSGNRLREHMSIFGASGTGKSQFLLAFLSSFFERKADETRVIIVDRKGEFFAHFGREGDIIFNPYDARSVKWSLFNELDMDANKADEMPADVRAVAKILFPERGGNVDPFWQQAAADVFCSAVMCCIRAGKTSNKDLVNFCNQSAADVIKVFSNLPDGLAAGRVLGDDPTSPTAGSILSVLKAGLQSLSVCPDGDFCVRDWLHQDDGGNLFLSSAGKNDSVFIPILALFVDLIGRELKEVPDGGAGGVRYLITVDELAAYPKMQTLHYLVAEARSKGVSCVLATQTIQKVLKIYGEKDGKDIIGNTKSKIIFRTIEAQDAEYLSKTIGASEVQREILAANENASILLGKVDGREGETKTKQIITEPVFLPGDLQTLDTGRAVVIHPAAGDAVAAVQFAPFSGEKTGVEFQPIDRETITAREYIEIKKQQDAEAAKKKEEEEKARGIAEAAQLMRNIEKTEQTEEKKEDNQPQQTEEKAEAAGSVEPEPKKKKGYLL